MKNKIENAIKFMSSDDDDQATNGVEIAVSFGQDSVDQLLAEIKNGKDGYSEKNYYLSKTLGLIGGDKAVKGMLHLFIESKNQNGYKPLFNFFKDARLESFKQALKEDKFNDAAALAKVCL